MFALEIKNVRFGSNENIKRVVLDLSEKSKYNYSLNEKKLVINFDKKIRNSKIFEKFNNNIKNIIIKEKSNEVLITFFDFAYLKKIFLINSDKKPRLVIDYQIKEKFNNDNVKVLVIDPGHGGRDSGAVGIRNILEKNVTLSIAKKLKEKFKSDKKYKVILTRTNDKYLKLKERVRKARKFKADLFISLHADYHRNKKVNGVSVYTLSEKASDKEAAALARRENKEDLIEGLDLSSESKEVTNILIDLAQRETMNQSSIFVNFLIKEFKKNTKLLQRTHRFAGFAVLKAPDIPSVLIEMGYLSNIKDSGLLVDSSYHKKITNSIFEGVENYFKWKESNF